MANRRFDVICMGRAGVDLYGQQYGARLEDTRSMAKYLGGSSANMAAGMARQGLSVAMLTRVGDEHMGRFVREELARNGVDTSHVHTDPERLTGLVLLGIKDRDTFPLIFYRENCADAAIDGTDFDEGFIASARALAITGTHFSLAGTAEACRRAIEYARRNGTRTVLDIDYRPVLWGVAGHGQGESRFVSSDEVTRHLQEILPLFDLVVGTEEEFHIAGGSTDTLTALRAVRERSAATLVLKRGALGSAVFEGAIPGRLEDGARGPTIAVQVLNVLGAGDAFISGFMRGWMRDEPLEQCCLYGNACGAIVVSRHGCTPAIPTRPELDDYLSRFDSVTRPDLDARLNQLHRATLRRPRGTVCALAFDHRSQFEELAAACSADIARIPVLKRLIADAVLAVAEREQLGASAGVLVDERFGESVLESLTGTGLWMARPLESPQSRPLSFEYGCNVSATLQRWPTEHIAKCLVFYHPDDDAALKAEQGLRLRELYAACRLSGHELLLELILPDGREDSGTDTARAMRECYDMGVFPDWWKLPPPSVAAWPAIEAVIDEFDPWCHGVVLLGLNRPAEELVEGFARAVGRKYCRGFAIGRSIFVEPARRWLRGEVGDTAFREAVADNFTAMVVQWRGLHGIATEGVCTREVRA
ncbi:bifunctional 5-dehydro-2-deoxygluconokinase/5-dehydro-2-deoxyphosphogluconate aldolase [Parahaliea mediterranea]|uniref:5-dehydro-2-deoxygluconokinase n=1 Tax=Parahaliea mediterranea TaxID=651086 RepID=A0A939DDS9_9GAMM|nr:5-dehydro-2-deoxygluconokinase [Parahaliea mediterranea]MBN7796388.1 5-dehydro-2-deoxygluconokinase [Parahaliea mediterranea]